MLGPGQLVSALLPAVFHSPAAHFFPAFPAGLASQPQILIPGPFLAYQSLRSYLQPDPCKEALLVATQAVGMGTLSEVTGRTVLHTRASGTLQGSWIRDTSQRWWWSKYLHKLIHQLVANNQLAACANLGLMVAALIA